MPFRPNHEKAGGRKRGTQNKRTVGKLLKIDAYCAKRKYDPLCALVDIAVDPAIDLSIRLSCHKELAQYIYAKRKAVELSAPNDEQLNIVVELTKAES